ncbi:MAG: hypothetical protein K6C08_00880 [Oscillospiraceae bacterium]|nr:hypothetical protein [Oscillospiraceae bacterium]
MQKKWYRLDTAALIFPVIRRRDWCNVVRMSATLTEEVDPSLLQRAAEDLRHRFPSFYVSLHTGMFWHYLEEYSGPIRVQQDYAYPLTYMSGSEMKRCCLRVFYYRNRIAIEFFHVITDGRGGCTYLANLLRRYLTLKYGVNVPSGGILKEPEEAPKPEELEDSFLKYGAKVAASRAESKSYRLHGHKEAAGFRHLITGIVDSDALLAAAHRYKVSVTAYLAAVMAKSIIEMQNTEVPLALRRPVKITIPVDLRRLYGSETLRNFSLVLNLGVDPRFGSYTLQDLCTSISSQLRTYATPQYMAGMIAANVLPQQLPLLRAVPIGVKGVVMNSVYRRSGESGGCLNISNLGQLKLPDEMEQHIRRLEFIIGPQRSYPNNCSILSYGGRTYINMIRNIRESELERRFFSALVEEGLAVDIESNRWE